MLILIAAVDSHFGIGKNNEMPWSVPADLQYFKNVTMGHPCVMGSRTFASIKARNGKPLPGRENIVVSHLCPKVQDGVTFVDGLLPVLQRAEKEDIYVIGGGQIYRQTIARADKLMLTHINGTFDCDTFFPCPYPDVWKGVSHQPADGCVFSVYERK
jgi:dihydrofolate reductase